MKLRRVCMDNVVMFLSIGRIRKPLHTDQAEFFLFRKLSSLYTRTINLLSKLALITCRIVEFDLGSLRLRPSHPKTN
jgi:hypothetical protein